MVNKAKKQSNKQVNIISAYKAFWKRGFTDWQGKSSRPEFWWAALVNILIACGTLVLSYVFVSLGLAAIGAMLLFVLGIYGLAAVVPGISLGIRRLRDAGLTPWLILILVASFLCGEIGMNLVANILDICWLVLMALPTKK